MIKYIKILCIMISILYTILYQERQEEKYIDFVD